MTVLVARKALAGSNVELRNTCGVTTVKVGVDVQESRRPSTHYLKKDIPATGTPVTITVPGAHQEDFNVEIRV